ncbi:hypothetical protein [Cryptosporangium sp. NPDC048952]|uniref:hypothetical protein n=1 Tax=Cryptosporangium sp. NPDC048952 TaxID=3363961 RepID=UPI003717AB1D
MLRYCEAFVSRPRARMDQRFLAMAQRAMDSVRYHGATQQSEDLGIGFAIVLAKRILHERDPGRTYLAVDAEMVLEAGTDDSRLFGERLKSRADTKMRPDYFLLGTKRGNGRTATSVLVLECKGTRDGYHAPEQLAKAMAQLDSVRIGSRRPPGLAIASILSPRHVAARILDPDGDDALWEGADRELDREPEDSVIPLEPLVPESHADDPPTQDMALFSERDYPEILGAPSADPSARSINAPTHDSLVFAISDAKRQWFSQVLTRTAAFGAMLFAGDDRGAFRLLPTKLAPESLPESGESYLESTDLGDFVGTSQTLRWINGKRALRSRGRALRSRRQPLRPLPGRHRPRDGNDNSGRH